jgi:hypothetical protein
MVINELLVCQSVMSESRDAAERSNLDEQWM